MTGPMGGLSADTLSNTLTAEMSSVLRAKGADLDDERACMVALTGERFRSGDIVALIDDAIAEAKRAMHAADDPHWAKDETWGGR